MNIFPNQPIPPNPKIAFVDKHTGTLSTYGLQVMQQVWALIANTNPVMPCTCITTGNLYALTPFPSKANALAFTGKINAYIDYSIYTFVAPATSTGPVTASVAPFGVLNVYKADGITQASAGDILIFALYFLIFNSALNGGIGGFVVGTVTPSSTTAPVSNFNVVLQTFSSSGTYFPTANMKFAIVECTGAGGGGGGCVGSATGISSGGGGGGGGYARSVVTAAQVGASLPATVGSGGTGGAAGANNGLPGGTTSLDTFVSATGGAGGTAATTANSNGTGGANGVGTVGTILLAGTFGGDGGRASIITLSVPSGFGGGSCFPGGFTPGVMSPTGNASVNGNGAFNQGCGGSGAVSHSVATNAAGGNGAGGLIIITEFCD